MPGFLKLDPTYLDPIYSDLIYLDPIYPDPKPMPGLKF